MTTLKEDLLKVEKFLDANPEIYTSQVRELEELVERVREKFAAAKAHAVEKTWLRCEYFSCCTSYMWDDRCAFQDWAWEKYAGKKDPHDCLEEYIGSGHQMRSVLEFGIGDNQDNPIVRMRDRIRRRKMSAENRRIMLAYAKEQAAAARKEAANA